MSLLPLPLGEFPDVWEDVLGVWATSSSDSESRAVSVSCSLSEAMVDGSTDAPGELARDDVDDEADDDDDDEEAEEDDDDEEEDDDDDDDDEEEEEGEGDPIYDNHYSSDNDDDDGSELHDESTGASTGALRSVHSLASAIQQHLVLQRHSATQLPRASRQVSGYDNMGDSAEEDEESEDEEDGVTSSKPINSLSAIPSTLSPFAHADIYSDSDSEEVYPEDQGDNTQQIPAVVKFSLDSESRISSSNNSNSNNKRAPDNNSNNYNNNNLNTQHTTTTMEKGRKLTSPDRAT